MELYFYLLQWFLIVIILIIPIMWLFCSTFRYYIKMGLFYFFIFFSAQVAFFLVVPFYGDVANYRTVRWLFIALAQYCDIKWELRGAEHLISLSPFVVICNHQSSLDLLGMITIWPNRCVVVIKHTMKYLGVFGITAMACGSVFIERFNHDKAVDALKGACEQIKRTNVKIWMFVEGTRNRGTGLLPFKRGAFHLAVQGQIPIVPVVFSHFKCFYSKNERKFLPNGYVIIQALPPVSTKGKTAENVSELIDYCQEKMLSSYNSISAEAEQRFKTGDY